MIFWIGFSRSFSSSDAFSLECDQWVSHRVIGLGFLISFFLFKSFKKFQEGSITRVHFQCFRTVLRKKKKKEKDPKIYFSKILRKFGNSFFFSGLKAVVRRLSINPAGYCIFEINSKSTSTRCEICSKLTIKTPERFHTLFLLFLLLTLSR